MTESVLPLAWLDELLNSPAVDFSQLNPFVDEKENASALAVDTSPIQHFGRFAGHSFSSQLEGLMPALSKSELELETAALAKPPAGTSRTKQRLKQSKARRLSGVRTDAARRVRVAVATRVETRSKTNSSFAADGNRRAQARGAQARSARRLLDAESCQPIWSHPDSRQVPACQQKVARSCAAPAALGGARDFRDHSIAGAWSLISVGLIAY